MPWLRLDDTFLDHPKVVGLSDRHLRQHLAAMLYAARHRTGGLLPDPALKALRISTKTTATFIEKGLWDQHENGDVFVHDFDFYNPVDTTQADRAKRYRERKKQGSERDASRVTANGSSRHRHVTPLARAQAGARGPSPTPLEQDLAAAEVNPRATGDEPAAANLRNQLDQLGLGPEWIQAALLDIDRAQAWLDRTATHAQRNPAGYFRRGFETNLWPTTTTPRIDAPTRRERYVQTVGHLLERDHLEHELLHMGADSVEVEELLDLANTLRGT